MLAKFSKPILKTTIGVTGCAAKTALSGVPSTKEASSIMLVAPLVPNMARLGFGSGLYRADAMALNECGAGEEETMVHLMWHHLMNMNHMVRTANEWDELGPFIGRLRKFGDNKLMKLMKDWKKKMSAIWKYNVTSVEYAVVARPLEEGPVEANAPPMMDVHADGVEEGVQLSEADGVIQITLVDDGLPLVELEAAAAIVSGARSSCSGCMFMQWMKPERANS